MLKASEFRELVSGRQRGPAAGLLRGLLWLTEIPYAGFMRRRNRAFDSGRLKSHRAEAPVVSVGNLTLGGTGKTPMVLWLAHWFARLGIKVALVSRGYKASGDSRNDEALELEQSLPDVPHLQNSDRVAAARQAVKEHECRLILLDDGFQHRRLARDLDIVLLDALEPFGFGHVFPRGTLREPLDAFARAQVAVLTRADLADEAERARIRGIVECYAPKIVWAECRHAPRTLISAGGKREEFASLRGRRVAAFCGIGNPAGFRHTLDQCGCSVVAWREFPDHHRYTRDELNDLARWGNTHRADALVCTLKDLVKLNVAAAGNIPLWAVQIELEFLYGQHALEARLEPLAAACSRGA